MKIGKSQEITTATFTSTPAAETGKEAANILDSNTIEVWGVTGTTGTLLLEFTNPIYMDTLALFNIKVSNRAYVTIKAYTNYPDDLFFTGTIDYNSLTGYEQKNMVFNISGTVKTDNDDFILNEYILGEHILGGFFPERKISAVEIIVTGAETSIEIGYLWGGVMIDFGCAEKIQPIDQSQDDVTITRGNQPDTNRRYNLQQYSVTLKKENDYETLRTNMRLILTDGFGTPRPYIIDEPFLSTDEVLLGIMDSGKVGYDIIDVDAGGFIAQTTIGVREVF